MKVKSFLSSKLNCFQELGNIMGGGYKVNIMHPLFLKKNHITGKLLC